MTFFLAGAAGVKPASTGSEPVVHSIYQTPIDKTDLCYFYLMSE